MASKWKTTRFPYFDLSVFTVGETPEEYDYLELLEGQGKREGDIMENPGVLPHMKNLYNESLIDPEGIHFAIFN